MFSNNFCSQEWKITSKEATYFQKPIIVDRNEISPLLILWLLHYGRTGRKYTKCFVLESTVLDWNMSLRGISEVRLANLLPTSNPRWDLKKNSSNYLRMWRSFVSDVINGLKSLATSVMYAWAFLTEVPLDKLCTKNQSLPSSNL